MNLELTNEDRFTILRALFSLNPSPSTLIQRIVDLREIAVDGPSVTQDDLPVQRVTETPDRSIAPTPAAEPTSLVNAETELGLPKFYEVEVEVETGSGKNKKVELVKRMQMEGKVISVSPVKKSSKGSEFITLVIAELSSDIKTITPHAQFHCFHKSLFDALKSAKSNSFIIFHYEPTIKQDDPKKLIWQNIEDICSVDGVTYLDGKPVK
jgi:hypothetical protein